MEETVLGIKGADFVIMAVSTTDARSISNRKPHQTKFCKLSGKMVFAGVSEPNSTMDCIAFIKKKFHIFETRNECLFTTASAPHFIRQCLADFLHLNIAYQINLLFAGYDEKRGPEMKYIDHVACGISLKYGGRGYGSMICLTVFDRYYKDNLTQNEAYEILRKCHAEIQKRMAIGLTNLNVCVVDKNGVHALPSITSTKGA